MKVRLVRSLIGRTEEQIRTVHSLGLRRVGDSRELPPSKTLLGMVEKVKFLLEVKS
jgi:large subunit ribosomal protein L30